MQKAAVYRPKEKIVPHLNEILSGIGRVMHFSIRVHLDAQGRPRIYTWNSVTGPGELIDEALLALDTTDETLFYREASRLRSTRQKRALSDAMAAATTSDSSAARLDGALLFLQIDIKPCLEKKRLDPNITCPNDVSEVAIDLLRPHIYPVS